MFSLLQSLLLMLLQTISNTANIAAFSISDVSAAIRIDTAFSPLRNRYCTAANVFTAVFAATDFTTAKTISNTANIAAFSISDVSAATRIDTAFSPLTNRYYTAANVCTAVVAATNSTTAKTISNSANIAALAIFDVPTSKVFLLLFD